MSLLESAYNSEQFEKDGIQLVELLANYLNACYSNEDNKAINLINPEGQLSFWKNFQASDSNDLFSNILDKSIHLHNPKYMGHQVVPPLPISALSTFIGAFINNGMATYDSGPASTTIEQVIVEKFLNHFDYDNNGSGFLTSGGTMATLTALLCARQTQSDDDIWENGLNEKLAIMVSDEAHYSVDKAVRIMGLGSKGVVKVPVDEGFKMRTDLLDKYYNAALKKGIKVIAVVGSAPSTSTGVYDNLVEIGHFCKQNSLWFHVDGAHGGAAIFSEKYKHLLNGANLADSICIDAHKMMLTPSLTTVLLYKDGAKSYATFRQKAQFLWDYANDEDWYNLAQRTLECTKYLMGFRLYSILNIYGTEIIDEYVTKMYDLAKEFSSLLESDINFHVPVSPVSNIVCFRYVSEEIKKNDLSVVNQQIRQRIIEDGEFHIVQTKLGDDTYLRTTLMNPFTDLNHLEQLIRKIKITAQSIINKTVSDSAISK